MDKHVLAGAAVLLAGTFGVLIAIRGDSAAPSTPAVPDTALALDGANEPAAQTSDLGFLGVVVSRTSVDFAAKFDSHLESVDVRPGDRVERGARLAMLDVRSAQQDLLMAEAALRTAEAEQQQTSLDVAEARARVDRLTRLTDLVSREQTATGHYQADLAETRLSRALAQVAERQARVDQLRETIRDADIRASFNGVVAARYLDPGSTVARGTPIVRVINPGALWLRFAVPESRAKEVGVGRRVTAQLQSPPRTVTAVVDRVTPEIDNALQMLVVEAAITGNATALTTISAGAAARVSALTTAAR